MKEDRGTSSKISGRVLGTILIVVVALGAVAAVAIPRFQSPRVSPPPPPSPCTGSACSPSSCAGSTCPSPSVTKSPPPIYQISFLASSNGTSLLLQFALTAQDHEFLARDGNVTFSMSDSQTNQMVYSENFTVRTNQFGNFSDPLGNRVLSYQWHVSISQVGILVFHSTGTAQLSFTASNGRIFQATYANIKLPTLTATEMEQLYESQYQQSAILVGQTVTKGYFNVTLVSFGNWTHPQHLSWGPLQTVFRVDFTATNIAAQTEALWPSYFYVVDDPSGYHIQPVGTSTLPVVLENVPSGETQAGYLLFPPLAPSSSPIIIAIVYTGSPIISYEFQVAI